jgi:ketosteroid isomerase-like protein
MHDVDKAFEAFIAAFNALDFERFRRYLSADVSLFAPRPDSPDLIEGADAVETHFAAVFRAEAPAGPGIRADNVRVRRLDEHAALVTFEFARPGGSTGRRSIVFRRERDGWKVVHLHASNTDAND